MRELKTLKGCGCRCKLLEASYCKKHNTNNMVSIKWLRAEAIKWVKDLELSIDTVDPLSAGGIKSTLMWIKMFFNLTEDDLK